MSISINHQPISFKKHIPIAKCEVKDRLSDGRNAQMTISELDCHDWQDVYEIDDLPMNRFEFRESLILNMANKFLKQGHDEEPDYEHYFVTTAYDYNKLYHPDRPDSNFYVMESPKSGIVGICQTHKENDKVLVDYISTKKECLYKYVGQTMLSALAKKALAENATEFVINNPVTSAMKFYTKKCGFKEDSEDENLYMDKTDMQEFTKRTQAKTNSTINIIG